jgi:nucleotide-binding universal stress UspA family protein
MASSPSHILAATDLTDTSHDAAAYAAALAVRLGVPMTLAHATELSVYPDGAVGLVEVVVADEAEVREELNRRAAILREGGATVSVECREGSPADTVLAMAAAVGTDLIVVGTKGNNGLKRLLLGSVAEQIVRLAPCPVVVVRAAANDEGS